MFPFPHYFGLDFSAALPWMLMGFVVGFLLNHIWSWIHGRRVRARAEAKVNAVQALLSAAKADHQADVQRLLSDAQNYEIALADAERRASLTGGRFEALTAEVEQLRQAQQVKSQDLAHASNEMARLRSQMLVAEREARIAAEERAAVAQEFANFKNRYQNYAADMAGARTAAEMKDGEIARLINQLQAYEAQSAAFEAEKQKLASGLVSSQGNTGHKDAEIARLQDELGAARAEIARAEDEAEARARDAATAAGNLDTAKKDLDYVRNLAYWEASEVARLRDLVTKFESDVAQKTSALGLLQQQVAAGPVRSAWRKPSSPGKSRLAYFRAQGMNGTSADAHGHAKGAGKLAFAHRHTGAGSVLARAKAAKRGKALKLAKSGKGSNVVTFASNGAGALYGARGRVLAHRTSAEPAVTATVPPRSEEVYKIELAALRARVAALTAEAETYRRFQEALAVANRIAGTGGASN